MPINKGFSLYGIYRTLVSKIISPTINPQHSCCFTHVHHPDQCACHSATVDGSELTTELFEIGETLVYTKEGHSLLVRVSDVCVDSNNVLKIKCTDANNEEIETTREFLRSPANPDIGWIPSTIPEYAQVSKGLSEEEIQKIKSSHTLSPLQQEFLSLHHRLLHLPFTTMLRLSKLGVLPRRFLKLKNNLPLCTSCLFGKAHRRPWRHKGSSSNKGVLRNKCTNEPGKIIGVDQMVSAQPGLVPQEKGSLTRARIWGATIFVDYATKWTKVHLMTDATGESTLEAKNSFEQACSSRGIDISHYHGDNGRFAEPLFVQDCKDKLQRITFCGVGAHHQNGVTENTIKQLTLSARTLLLHAQ